VSFAQMLRALGDEAAREADSLRAGGEAAARGAVEGARAAAAAARDSALVAARERHAARLEEALAAAGRERERALLDRARAALEGVRAEALARAIAGPLPEALVTILAAEAAGQDAEWVVDPGDEAAVARLARPARVRAAPARRGGVEVVVGRVTLDATAAARLERVWAELEPELGRILAGERGGDAR
jgi:vacuolar-type H+-ATPase subunit E/Vma4